MKLKLRGNNRRQLTPREQQIAALICLGQSNQEIAAELGRASNTVKRHISSLFDKSGCESRYHLMAFAHRRELELAVAAEAGKYAIEIAALTRDRDHYKQLYEHLVAAIAAKVAAL